MRARRLKLVLPVVCATCASLSFAATAPAAQVRVDGFTLQGAGPTIWDAANDDFAGGETDVDGCYIRDAYTPVLDGASFAGDRVRTGAFDNGAMFGIGIQQTGIYSSVGNGNFNRRTNTLSVGPSPVGGLSMSRKDTATGPLLRSLIKIRNPDADPFSGDVTWDNRLSLQEAPAATSSGDQAFTAADRWLIESPPQPAGYYGYQVLDFALYGKGAREKVTVVDFAVPADPCVTVNFNINVPAGETRYMLFFTGQHTTPGAATRSVKQYNRRHLSAKLLRGIPQAVRNKVLNWDL